MNKINDIPDNTKIKEPSSQYSRSPSIPAVSSSPTMNQAETIDLRALESGLIHELMRELNLEVSPSSASDIFTHREERNCIHCKLLGQVKLMESDILKLDNEMKYTHDVLVVKANQNAELKGTIKRLEESLGRSESSIDKKGLNCNCGSCDLF